MTAVSVRYEVLKVFYLLTTTSTDCTTNLAEGRWRKKRPNHHYFFLEFYFFIRHECCWYKCNNQLNQVHTLRNFQGTFIVQPEKHSIWILLNTDEYPRKTLMILTGDSIVHERQEAAVPWMIE